MDCVSLFLQNILSQIIILRFYRRRNGGKEGKRDLPRVFFFSTLKTNFIYLCLHWFFVAGLSLVAASGGYSLVAVRGLLIAVASLVAEHPL